MLHKVICPLLRYRHTILIESRFVNTILAYRFKSTKGDIVRSSRGEVDTNVNAMGEKVKENTKTVSYLGIILLGVGVTGTLFYAVFSELFSSRSPNNIYTAAIKKCLADYRIEDKLGLPIKAFGEETRRGRRQHPNYLGFIGRDGKKHLRMKFYLQGAFHKGIAQLEMIENDAGDYNYSYLIVDIDDLLQTRIIVEDNRHSKITMSSSEALSC